MNSFCLLISRNLKYRKITIKVRNFLNIDLSEVKLSRNSNSLENKCHILWTEKSDTLQCEKYMIRLNKLEIIRKIFWEFLWKIFFSSVRFFKNCLSTPCYFTTENLRFKFILRRLLQYVFLTIFSFWEKSVTFSIDTERP